MAQPKKQSSPRKTGLRRSHLLLKLARRVNGKSPVKVRTTKRESAKVTTETTVAKKAVKAPAKAKSATTKKTLSK